MATNKHVQPARRTSGRRRRPPSGSARSRTFPRRRDATSASRPRGRARGGRAGRSLEDRNREQPYELAKERGIAGRSKMGKWELIEALRPR